MKLGSETLVFLCTFRSFISQIFCFSFIKTSNAHTSDKWAGLLILQYLPIINPLIQSMLFCPQWFTLRKVNVLQVNSSQKQMNETLNMLRSLIQPFIQRRTCLNGKSSVLHCLTPALLLEMSRDPRFQRDPLGPWAERPGGFKVKPAAFRGEHWTESRCVPGVMLMQISAGVKVSPPHTPVPPVPCPKILNV